MKYAISAIFAIVILAPTAWYFSPYGPSGFDECVANGELAIQNEDWPSAVYWYERATAFSQADSTVWNNLGWSHYNNDDLESAKSCYDKAIDLDPKNVDALVNLAGVYEEQGELEREEECIDLAIKLSPPDSDLYRFRADIARRKGMDQQATSWEQKALAID